MDFCSSWKEDCNLSFEGSQEMSKRAGLRLAKMHSSSLMLLSRPAPPPQHNCTTINEFTTSQDITWVLTGCWWLLAWIMQSIKSKCMWWKWLIILGSLLYTIQYAVYSVYLLYPVLAYQGTKCEDHWLLLMPCSSHGIQGCPFQDATQADGLIDAVNDAP